MDPVAYKPAEGFEDLSGGTTHLRDGSTFDFVEALDRGAELYGHRVLVTVDPALTSILDNIPALARADLPVKLEDLNDDALSGRTAAETPELREVDPAVAGLSGAANEGQPVDAFGMPLIDAQPGQSTEPPAEKVQALALITDQDLAALDGAPDALDRVREAIVTVGGDDLAVALKKDRLEQLAAALDVDTSGTKADLADRLVDASAPDQPDASGNDDTPEG